MSIYEIEDGISKGIALKRGGAFKEASNIYANLNNKYPNNPDIIMSWAKIYVCLGEYDEAMNKYQLASRLFREISRGDYYQCDLQIMDIENRFNDPEKFKSWVYAISGCSISIDDIKL